MNSDTYDLLDQTLLDPKFKTASDVVSYVVSNSNDFIEMSDVAWMLSVANQQFKNGKTIRLFKKKDEV